MRSNLTSMARNALEHQRAARLRLAIVHREASKERTFVRSESRRGGFRELGLRALAPFIPTEDRRTLFILGGGASVEKLSESNFKEISSGFSIGINAWALHKFIPNMYSYEPVGSQYPTADHLTTMRVLSRKDVVEAGPAILVLRPRNEFERSQMNQLTPELRKNVFLYGRVTPFTRNPENLGSELRGMANLFSRTPNQLILPDAGASIVRMTFLGIFMGFSEIVYVGVDLNNTKYFWEENPSHLLQHGLTSFDSGQNSGASLHETLSPKNRPFIVTKMLSAIVNDVAVDYGVTMSVASPESALQSFMPLYAWDS